MNEDDRIFAFCAVLLAILAAGALFGAFWADNQNRLDRAEKVRISMCKDIESPTLRIACINHQKVGK